MQNISLLKKDLFSMLKKKGAKLMGVADLTGIVKGSMQTGISVAVPIPKHIVRDLQTAPTKEYYDAYYSLNTQLDEIVTSGAEFLTDQGYHAQANTTNVVKANEDWRTPLPHKTVATRAGLGWIGKSRLLVTREYGSAVRLSSLLTGTLWTPKTERETLFHKEDCKKMQIQRMKQATGIETDLCGLCFAVCPYTKKYLKEGQR